MVRMVAAPLSWTCRVEGIGGAPGLHGVEQIAGEDRLIARRDVGFSKTRSNCRFSMSNCRSSPFSF
jgi:hypothetical protein